MNNKYLESPFEFLKRKDGTNFSPEIVRNWYKARAYVLDKLKEVSFGPDSGGYLHVMIPDDSALSLCLARQVALCAHYINYDEVTGKNRTVITIVSQNPDILGVLEQEEWMGNLPKFCKSVVYGETSNADSFLDIELQVVRDPDDCTEKGYVEMTGDEAESFCKSVNYDKIDTRKAVFAHRIYDLGTLIFNIPYEDIHSVKRYSQALDSFQYFQMERPWKPLVEAEKWKNDLNRVRSGLSNIFCSDCFETRKREIDNKKQYDKDSADSREEVKRIDAVNYWEKYHDVLAGSEHLRWVVERLIMGHRPLNVQERIGIERTFGSQKKKYCNVLKRSTEDPAHIDLCSFAELRRVDPDNMKYDSFLMLAIPDILKKVED